MMKAKKKVEALQNYSEIKAGKEQSDHKTTSSMTFPATNGYIWSQWQCH